MQDQLRSSPQPIPNFHPSSSPIPSQLRPNDPNSTQPSSVPITNSRTLQRNTGLNRSSTMVLPHDKPINQVPQHAASDHGHTRLYDPPTNIQTFIPSPSRPSSRGAPSSVYSEDKGSPVSQTAPASSLSQTHSNYSTSTVSAQPCSSCGLTMSGQFVRALGNVYHLDCFRCRVCGLSLFPVFLSHP